MTRMNVVKYVTWVTWMTNMTGLTGMNTMTIMTDMTVMTYKQFFYCSPIVVLVTIVENGEVAGKHTK